MVASIITSSLGWLGTVLAMLLFSAPYKRLSNALKQKQVIHKQEEQLSNKSDNTFIRGRSSEIDIENLSVFPYLSMNVNCLIWVTYAIIVNDTTLTITNGYGFVISCYFCWMYYKLTDKKEDFISKCSVALLIYMLALGFVLFIAPTHQVTNYLGTIAATGSVIMFGSPLINLKQVIEKKNAESIDLLVAIANTSCAFTWLLYGYLLSISAIYIPNFLGFCLGIVQLFLKFIFRKSQLRVFSLSPVARVDQQQQVKTQEDLV
ncbi:hypothetical protein ABK040_002310 [Willaertia magna]